MALTQKMSDVGWIYHAPAKASEGPSVTEVAPASQIPGLNEFPEGYFPPDEPKRMQIHEHDSAYIRLAKQGGRPDLLRQRTPKAAPTEAKAYPRVDWYYQDDIKMENDMHKPPEVEPSSYEFSLPEYMVHQEYKPFGDAPAANQHRGKNIFSRDQTNVFQREGGRHATDKTVRLEEDRAQGYGIRQEKNVGRKPKQTHPVQPIVKARAPSPEFQSPYAKIRSMPQPKEEEKPPMSKLLSFGYARDWEEQKQQWENEHSNCHPDVKHEKNVTEYQSNMQLANGTGRPRVASHGRRAPPSSNSRASSGVSEAHRRQRTHEDAEKPDFFSLSKQESGPSRMNSRRTRSELQPAMLKGN